MAALPYIQLYPADYLADTSHLTTIEHGAYLLLIMNYWQRGEPFHARDQQTLSERLARITRMTGEEWASIEPVIAEFFEVSKTQWRHLRIERDLAAVLRKSTQARHAGKASGEKRKSEESKKQQNSDENINAGKTKDSELAFNGRSTEAERAMNHTDTDTDTDTELKNPPISPQGGEAISQPSLLVDSEPQQPAVAPAKKNGHARDEAFARFWEAYPRKVAKHAARQVFDKIKLDPETLDRIVAAADAYRKKVARDGTDPQYIKHPSGWLNARRWEDEPEPEKYTLHHIPTDISAFANFAF